MENTFITVESYAHASELVFDGSEPRQPSSAMASYRCKVYRARLDQGSESQHIMPAYLSKPKNVRD
jgi:hypothetical protein